ncbi:MAG: cation-transporting P-type ATPase [Candidatus Bathyarchaeota archaeon]|nr:cation-transporting P-type ATPase [Candidatus Bathyarchaeota archaeon]
MQQKTQKPKQAQAKILQVICTIFLGHVTPQVYNPNTKKTIDGTTMSQMHSKQPQQATEELGVNPQRGLSSQQAAQRLSQYGKNSLVQPREIRFLSILREEITEPMILLLLAIGVLYSVLGFLANTGFTDAATIIVIIIVLVLAEVWNEYRAKRSVNALRQLAPPTALVLRDGQPVEVETAVLVPGDVLLLKVGQRIAADARLLEAYGLEIDESSLTGESFAAQKDAKAVLPAETPIIDQTNMLFTGTVITRGSGRALVTATGVRTELGRISGITQAAKEPKTELQLAMKQLSKTLVWVALFFSILIPILSYVRGLQPGPAEAVLYGLSLAFVVIPEELPIIITMVLGVGSYALSRRGAIVKRLRAAETLGNVTVIATDKTGTITENKMRLEHLYFDGAVTASVKFGPNEKSALRTALLASDAPRNYSDKAFIGNPMAQAILERLKQENLTIAELSEGWVLKNELSFDVNRKVASYIYQYGNAQVVLSSGAPERILANASRILLRGEETAISDEIRQEATRVIVEMAKSGERLLAFGYHRLPANDEAGVNLEGNIVFVGVAGFIDPPRREVRGAILSCQQAGIKVIMITGDHPQTAKTIAGQVSIPNSRVLTGSDISNMPDSELKAALRSTFVFARATPEDKLRLVRLLKENGETVAVTGDGINDAPALKEAHIGIAMGLRGTDVAKEAADMILTDDNFATIENAVKEGRRLYSNLRKGVRYYLACKVALVSIFLIPIILGIPLPFAPIQIIVLELFMDLAASATFVAEPQEAGAMKKPPISARERFINKQLLRTLFLGAISLFVAVTVTYLVAWYTASATMTPADAETYARTVAFATWMFGHIFLAFNFRSEQEPLLKEGLLSNKVMLLWALLVFAVLVAGTTLAPLQAALQITSLQALDWVLVVGVAFVSTFWMEAAKLLGKRL